MVFSVRTLPTGPEDLIVDASYADAYFTKRGIAAWTGDVDLVKRPMLLRATDYIDGRFASRYLDEVLDGTWALGVMVPTTSIPDVLARACCEYALRAIAAPLAPDPTIDPSGARVVNTMKKLGPLEKQFQMVKPGVTPPLFRPYPAADMLLTALLKPTSSTVYR